MSGINKSIPVNISFPESKVTAFYEGLRTSFFPSSPPLDATSRKLGVDYAWLKKLKDNLEDPQKWLYGKFIENVNKLPHYFVENLEDDGFVINRLHFVHVKSERTDAIPLLLLHGWPGTFWDFQEVIEPLTNPPSGVTAFHLVIPSLPGYFLSTHPKKEGWTIVNTARIFNHLMVNILGYEKYAAQGGDWGSYILRIMGNLFSDKAPAIHFNMFRCPKLPQSANTVLSDIEKRLMARRKDFDATGRGYVDIQSTKPITLGLAVGSSPLGILAYIGEKIAAWSDDRHLNDTFVQDTVALYFLSDSFATSVLIYNQSFQVRSELTGDETKWRIKSKIGYSAFPYEIGASPRADIAAVGPLVFYKEHDRGGHFAATDAPEEFVSDLREFFGAHWA